MPDDPLQPAGMTPGDIARASRAAWGDEAAPAADLGAACRPLAMCWMWRPSSDELRWSSGVCPPVFLAMRNGSSLLANVRGNDPARVVTVLHGAAAAGGHAEMDLRLAMPDGGAWWVHARVVGPDQVCLALESGYGHGAMRAVLRGTISATGPEFFERLAEQMSVATGVKRVVVSEIVPERPTYARTLAVCDDDGPRPAAEYPLEGTPSERVIRDGVLAMGHGVAAEFPGCGMAAQLGAQSAVGVSLVDQHGRALGLVGLLHNRPMPGPLDDLVSLLRLFAARASGELNRMRAERALRISERRYRVLHDSNPQMIFTVDRAGRVLDVNQAGATRLGYLPHQLIGRSVLEVFDEVHHASVLARLAACFASPSEVLSWHAVKRAANGREVHVEEAARVVPNLSGGDSHVVIFCTDVTERVRAEESLRQREEQLRHAQKLEAVGTLASGVAHDLNNLLTAIQGFVSLASRALPTGHPALESLRQVEEATRQASGVTGSLLTFARKRRTIKAPVELTRLTEAGVRLLRRTAPATLTIRVEHPDERGLWGLVDETQMHQVVMNLGTNARDALGGRGTITFSLRPVEDEGQRWVELVCRDEGVGMTPEVLARVFEPFFSTKPPEKGVGLGLAIVHGIVADHGGTVRIRSAPGRGTEVCVRLPRVDADATPPPPPAGPVAPEQALGGRALVIEPNQLVRGLLGSLLQALGYDTTMVDAPAAVRAAGGAGTGGAGAEFDLLVTNRWPLDAPWLTAQLRGGGAGRVLVVHSGQDEGFEVPAGVGVLVKPFRLRDLRDSLLALRRGAGESGGKPAGEHV